MSQIEEAAEATRVKLPEAVSTRFIIYRAGNLQVKRLRRAAVIAIFPWNGSIDPIPEPKPVPKERRDPLKLACYYQSLLDSGKFESRAALARYLGVSRARVTQVLGRIQ